MTTDAKMETEYARPLGQLLSLETYQGMSDLEIETIIAHKLKDAYAQGQLDAVHSKAMANLEERERRYSELFARMQSVVKYEKAEGGTYGTARRSQAQKSSATKRSI